MVWKIGNVSITPVIELEMSVDKSWLIAEATPENLAPDLDWLKPHFIDEEGKLKFRVQALLVESCGKKIIIDTCIGNDKQLPEPPALPEFNGMNGPFLEDIAKSGFDRKEVDIVVCTHLHFDHVGWNTMKVNGEWIPTFPNARYLITQAELDFSRTYEDNEDVAQLWKKIYGNSVAPIFEAGLVDLVDCNYQITPELQLIPTPGHTPGHCSVKISSQGSEATVTGDMMHHPCQCAHPEWNYIGDASPEQAEKTRRTFLQQVCDNNTLVIGSHWAASKPVKIAKHKTAWKVEIH